MDMKLFNILNISLTKLLVILELSLILFDLYIFYFIYVFNLIKSFILMTHLRWLQEYMTILYIRVENKQIIWKKCWKKHLLLITLKWFMKFAIWVSLSTNNDKVKVTQRTQNAGNHVLLYEI